MVGAYASGGRDFPDALALAATAPLAGYVDAVYPLSRWREAIGHAARPDGSAPSRSRSIPEERPVGRQLL